MRLTVARVRKTVLRELYAMFLRAPQNATTFEVGDEVSSPIKQVYQTALSQLVSQQLVDTKTTENGVSFAYKLNAQRIDDAKREITPFWKKATFYAWLIPLLVAIAGVTITLLQLKRM